MDYNSTDYWRNTTNYHSFELRSHRFREEELPAFFHRLGINKDSVVLDAGCGSGVFTRFLAKGLTAGTGHITGFDVNEGFIEFGNRKLAELGLSQHAALETADGYNLHYADNHFDAVTNYTYIGVLADKAAGLKEMIRVCKIGGVVSCVVSTFAFQNFVYMGDYPFEGAKRLQQLREAEEKIFTGIKSAGVSQMTELILFRELGLTEIHVYPFAHLMCYSDTNFPYEYRKTLAIEEAEDELNWLKSRYAENEKAYSEQGFTSADFEELITLLKIKSDYLKNNFDTDNSFEWRGGFNYIVTGIKR
jgi:ubiquinone/menaquinone biosynthesis C-methylase UbiE